MLEESLDLYITITLNGTKSQEIDFLQLKDTFF
jgi:hypothetical protein